MLIRPQETDFIVGEKGEQQYGISGCGVFKAGIQNQKGFWLKINCIQMKLPNFENWSNGELLKIGHHFSNKRL